MSNNFMIGKHKNKRNELTNNYKKYNKMQHQFSGITKSLRQK